MLDEITSHFAVGAPEFAAEFTCEIWQHVPPLMLRYDWRGNPAPPQLYTEVRTLWTMEKLYFGFTCNYTELDIDSEYDLNEERYALWDRDVCEAFIRSPIEPAITSYKEFQVAPTAQWCDLTIDRAQMVHEWKWRSRMRTAAKIDQANYQWRALMAIPFSAFGLTPQRNEVWHANLFRISRLHGERQYLALSPTETEQPNFHVPERFIKLKFA